MPLHSDIDPAAASILDPFFYPLSSLYASTFIYLAGIEKKIHTVPVKMVVCCTMFDWILYVQANI